MQCKPVRKFSAFILKYFITIVFILSCNGCAIYPVKDRGDESRQTKQQDTQADAMTACPGNTDLPVALADQFEAVEDTALLLKMALAQLKKGKLCQGKVYKSKANRPVSVYRAWNSTNPKSKMGPLVGIHKPDGKHVAVSLRL